MHSFTTIAAIAALAGQALAVCPMPSGGSAGVEADQKLCVPQGEGSYTFSMRVSLIDVPTPDKTGAGTGSTEQANSFFIYDNACNTKGIYEAPSCGIPWTIEENFLQDVLTVDTVNMDVGDPFFSFLYGNGKFSIRNNQCGCQDANNGLEAVVECKCAFPVNGIVSRDLNEREEPSEESKKLFRRVVGKMAQNLRN